MIQLCKHFVLFVFIIACMFMAASASDTIPDISINDGPYIYINNDSLYTILYVCNNEFVKFSYTASDTLRFQGYCHDSSISYIIPLDSRPETKSKYENVPKIFSISDIHGNFYEMVQLLQNHSIIDKELNWIWGDGHLVIDGDIFDRGEYVTECLWLIYRLELQALSKGGYVHYLIGNHELMVIRGDNRYINDKYMNGIAKKSRIKHEDLYGPDMILGKWLRTKNTVIVINGILFVHGGISPQIIEKGWPLNTLNSMGRSFLNLRSSQIVFNDEARLLFGSLGPYWYRGYHYAMENKYPITGDTELNNILEFFEARAIVVGHTGVDEVFGIHNGRVFAIDIPLEDLGCFQGLLWENDEFYRAKGDGSIIPLDNPAWK